MKHIMTLDTRNMKDSAVNKTSCGIANQNCENKQAAK